MQYNVVVINGYEWTLVTICGKKRLTIAFLSDEEEFTRTSYESVSLKALEKVDNFLIETVENNTASTELNEVVLLTTILAKIHKIVFEEKE